MQKSGRKSGVESYKFNRKDAVLIFVCK